MTTILGPVPCHGCGAPVVVDRVGSYLRTLDKRHRLHVCRRPHSPETWDGEAGPCIHCGRPVYPIESGYFRHGQRCLAPMKYGQLCHRRKGHSEIGNGSGHRSEYAMLNGANPGRWVNVA